MEFNVKEDVIREADLVELIEHWGIQKLLGWTGRPCESLIKEFLANISRQIKQPGNNFRWSVYVRGRLVPFSPSNIRRWLELSPITEGMDDEFEAATDTLALELTGNPWPKGKMTAALLTPKYKVLHKIALHNIDPIQHRSDIGMDKVELLYKLGTYYPLDIATIIFEKIVFAATRQAHSRMLPFPGLLHAYLQHHKVPIVQGDTFTAPIPVLRPSKKVTKRPTPPARPSLSEDYTSSLETQIRNLTTLVTTLSDHFERHHRFVRSFLVALAERTGTPIPEEHQDAAMNPPQNPDIGSDGTQHPDIGLENSPRTDLDADMSPHPDVASMPSSTKRKKKTQTGGSKKRTRKSTA
ncbi:Envelope-like protein [Abeliophyllum distichum]|uniref:Envelope-like protein n=1 Tax=Abeliophyllum distichum TaxID=126358 RepID=A0ABD1VPK4_9LAMI